MKKIEKDELYQNLTKFLQTKGIALQEGSYAQTIQKSCRILADVINLGQHGFGRAKDGIDKGLKQVREVIQRKTAPKPPRHPQSATAAAGTPPPTPKASQSAKPPKIRATARPRKTAKPARAAKTKKPAAKPRGRRSA